MRYPASPARLMLSAALVLALAACSGAEEAPAPDAGESAAAPTAASSTTASAGDAALDPAATASATPTPAASASASPDAKATTAAGTAKPGPEAKPSASPAVVAAASPPASFARCATCHTVDKGGENRLGPNLWGTYGKSAGVHAGFAYSDALKTSGLVWNDANLDKWLENPRALVPGNRMSFPGLKDAAKRREIIDYIKALR